MNQISRLQSKILSFEALKILLKKWRDENEKIIFTNGCFDLLHLGHVDYLAKARDLGGRLVVGLNSDASIKRIKGPSRPINNEQSRAALLAGMTYVDAVVLFDEETPVNLISEVMPAVLVKGGDYKIKEIVGHEMVLNNGGEVCTIDFVEGYSSSELIKKFKAS
ncbi:MAG: D-glycero-beta-D-manno-heptose 1-phosphate adenylyltransferase [Bacteroidetes bacterium MED-G21]|nr:MAG: D-glycero-beta-D-manno-heptose 1-phosphate adenylyltransferase [Bacteroidetes bacterium MED-G21]